MACKQGDKIRVVITGTAGPKPRRGLAATNQVTEEWTHYLFLGSPRITGDKTPGGTVRAEFTAEITGDIGASLNNTTEVTEIREGDGSRFVHYVYLGSSCVTSLATAAEEEAGPENVLTRAEVIESTAVFARIAALEEKTRPTEFTITQARTGARMGLSLTFATRAAATEYLDNLDYNPERFVIEPVAGRRTAAEDEELRLLNRLNAAGADMFGAARWTKGVTLRPDSLYSAEWARDQASARLGIGSELLDDWPFSAPDFWEDAATRLLDADYRAVTVGGRLFFGKNAAG